MNPRAIKKHATYFDYCGFGTSPRIGVQLLIPEEHVGQAMEDIDHHGRAFIPQENTPGRLAVFVWEKRLYNRPSRLLSSLARATRRYGIRIVSRKARWNW